MRLSFVIIFRPDDEKYLDELILSLPKDEVEYILVKTVKKSEAKDYLITDIEEYEKTKIALMECPEGRFKFDIARNKANELATGKYIFNLDADERLLVHQHHLIYTLLDLMDKHTDIGGIRTRNISMIPDFEANDGTYKEGIGKQVKLFRNIKEIYYVGNIHETVTQAIRDCGKVINDSTVIIHHIGFETNIDNIIAKTERNVEGMMCQGEFVYNNKHIFDIFIRDLDSLQILKKVKENNDGNNTTSALSK